MKLIHHGMTLELANDDPRVKVIEALLAAFPAPSTTQAIEPAPAPKVEAPPAPEEPTDWITVEPWLAFWRQLRPEARTWLTSLATQGPVCMTDVRKHVRIRRNGLASLHAHIARMARIHGFKPFIEARGHGRKRRYSIAPSALEPLSKYANVGR